MPSKGKILSFADDTAIVYTEDSWSKVRSIAEEDFAVIKKWFNTNLLTINFSKTRYLPFTSYQSHLPNFGPLNIDTGKDNDKMLIEEAESIKYLGIIIDRHLKWDLQINNIIKKIRSLLPIFKNLKHYLDLPQLNVLYYSLIQSHLSYGIIGWGGVTNNYLQNLNNMQKWFLKIIYSKDILYSTERLYNETKKLDLRQLFCQKILINIFKTRQNIKFREHTYNTRTKNLLTEKPYAKKTIGQRNHTYLAPRLFDMLPPEIKNIKSYKMYKRQIKHWIETTQRLLIHQLIDTKT